MFNYFEDAFGIPIYRAPIEKTIEGRKFLLGHGDGLGPGDHGYKFIKKVFANRFCQWLFARIHPNTGLRVMQYFSQRSRESTEVKQYLGPDHEWLIDYCEKKIATSPVDYFVFGHRHLPIQYLLSNGHSKYINLGDWLNFNSYAVFDGDNLRLKFFETEQIIYGNMRDV
jgi:UDP-2,3-diacylglucosamine hydrolase